MRVPLSRHRGRAGVLHAGRGQPARAAAEAGAHGPGHHVHGLRREGRARADLPLRLRAARRHRARVGTARGRARPARHRAQPLHRRRLRRAEVPQGQRAAARAPALAQGVQARAAQRAAAARRLHARRRHRHHPRRPRRVPGAGGQLPLPERRLLRARESQPHDARVPRAVRPLPGASDQGLSEPPARRAAARGPAHRREPGGRRALARHPQLGVLRALVPRARDGHDARTAARGRRLPPHRRGLPRSARVPARQPARRAGPAQRLPGGQRGHRQRSRRGRGRRQVRLRLHAAAHQVLPRRGGAARAGADVPRLPARGLRLHARARGRAGDQDHRRFRRLQHAHGAVRDARGDRRLRRAHAQGADELHRAAPRGAVHPPDLRRRPLRAAAHRPAALHSLWRRRARPARRSDAGGAARGLVRRELLPGRRQQGHLGARAPARRLMLSRVADAVYWMGRYLERAENITRLLFVTDDFATETQGFAEDLAQTAWKDVLAILPSAELTRPVSAFAPLSLPYLQSFFVDGKNPYSVHYSLRKARENARAVREALTVEVFMSINETFRAVEAHGERRPDATGLRDALASTHKGLFGIIGAIESTFTRDEAWHFFKLGAALERIYRTALILRAKLPALTGGARPDQPLYYTQWRSLLRSVSSLENYRRARGAGMEGDLVVAFLLFDPHSPRSLRATSAAIKDCLERIAVDGELSPAARLAGKLHADLSYDDERSARRASAAFLDRVVDTVTRTHEALTAQYFVS